VSPTVFREAGYRFFFFSREESSSGEEMKSEQRGKPTSDIRVTRFSPAGFWLSLLRVDSSSYHFSNSRGLLEQRSLNSAASNGRRRITCIGQISILISQSNQSNTPSDFRLFRINPERWVASRTPKAHGEARWESS
jgi:hypothetical protein